MPALEAANIVASMITAHRIAAKTKAGVFMRYSSYEEHAKMAPVARLRRGIEHLVGGD